LNHEKENKLRPAALDHKFTLNYFFRKFFLLKLKKKFVV